MYMHPLSIFFQPHVDTTADDMFVYVNYLKRPKAILIWDLEVHRKNTFTEDRGEL